jgi:alkylation response protein AidB-like acyl-CoA dehydrogenase
MDLRLDDEQNAIVDAVRTLCARTAGPQRARADGTDRQTLQRLDEAGFLDVAREGRARDYLAAVLVTEQAAQSLVMAPVGARALVATYAGIENPPAAFGLALDGQSHVRFGADVDAVLMLDQDEARLLWPDDLKAEPVESRLAFPLARVTARPGKGELLPPGSAARMRRAWRTLLAAEAGAAMIGAIEAARQHVSVRVQFGRPIGSLQAVQHRLGEAHVRAQGSMWLARRAAWHLDSELETALAAAYASAAALAVFDSVHQVVGAIGFTREFDLHMWSMRLPVLAAELGGQRAHAAAASAANWPSPAAKSAAG